MMNDTEEITIKVKRLHVINKIFSFLHPYISLSCLNPVLFIYKFRALRAIKGLSTKMPNKIQRQQTLTEMIVRFFFALPSSPYDAIYSSLSLFLSLSLSIIQKYIKYLQHTGHSVSFTSFHFMTLFIWGFRQCPG